MLAKAELKGLCKPGNILTQQLLTCPNSTIKTLKKMGNMFKVNDVVLVSLLLTLNIFHTFLFLFFVNFELVNISWERLLLSRCMSMSV